MATISMTHRYVSTYVESEPWKIDHDLAMECRKIEGAMAWGVRFFRAMVEDEATFQGRVFRGELSPDDPTISQSEKSYRALAWVLEMVLKSAERIASHGFAVDGLDDFRLVVEEAQCMVGSFDIEAEIRPMDELLLLVRPNNPDPARYGD